MPPKVSSADERLIAAYTEAALRLQRLLDSATPNQRRIILRRVDQILAELDVLTAEYIQQELPIQFQGGSDEAIRQLKTIRGFGDIEDTFGTIHTEAIAQLAEDATLRFANALQTVRMDAKARMTKLQKRKILGELIASEVEGTSNPAARVKKIFEDEGIVGFRTSNGRELNLEHYASTLTYTILAEAHNTGAMTRYAANGVGFVEIIERETACPICSPMRGKIVSLGDSRLVPPFHPNCFGGVRPFMGEPENPILTMDDPRIPDRTRQAMSRKG